MKDSDVATVLDAIAGFDGRNWTPSARESWASIIRHYPLADAIRAVQEHYAINEARVMPNHIRTRCLQLRDLRAAEEQRAIGPPARPQLTEVGRRARAEVLALIAQVGRRSEAAMRPPMRADASEPTSADSDITREVQQDALRRLRHEGPR